MLPESGMPKTGEPPGNDPVAPPESGARVQVPESDRSREVTARVGPKLAPRLAAAGLKPGAPVFVRIFKQERLLELWIRSGEKYQLFHTWPVVAQSGTLGPKLAEGDRQAPEGFYFVPPGMLHPSSRFHLGFNLGYPNVFDRSHGRTGSFILVHGSDVSIGCFAMTDPGIEEIYTLVEAALKAGQPFFRVHVFPFRMTDANLKAHAKSPHLDFWKNLRTGYDWFETHRVPPDVSVREGRYVFGPGE